MNSCTKHARSGVRETRARPPVLSHSASIPPAPLHGGLPL